MRLFVGIPVTEEIRAQMVRYVTAMRKSLRNDSGKWVKPESLHVTLKFIGESSRKAEIEAELKQITTAEPMVLTFHGVGFFTPRQPSVFWAGVQSGPELEALASEIDDRLQKCGVPREPHVYQQFQPHVTLARSGSGRPQGSPRDRNKSNMYELRDLVANQPQPDFGTMTADQFILYQSETLPSGAHYTPLARFRLG